MRKLALCLVLLTSITSAPACLVSGDGAIVVAPAPSGWVTLGERTVNGRGRVDRDVIHVGRSQGRYSRLQFVVENSAIEMYDMRVYLGDGSVYSPPTRLVFNPGQASHVLDLPGGARVIRKVEFFYRDLPGGGRARVILFGS
jgi:hypothetical protein